jgi:hypothetical protein
LAFAQPDARSLLQQSVENYEKDWRAGLAWSYTETEVSESAGEKEINVTEVIPVAGTPYDRMVEKDGQKLTGYELRREQEKFEKTCRERERESAAERAARVRKYESERAFVHEAPQAYDATLIGEDVVDGRPAWILQLTPRPGYQPVAPRAAMLKHISARLWIDKQDVRWVRAHAHVIDTISIGWVLARIGPGADIVFEQTRVADGLWMPKKICVQGVAKIMLVHDKDIDETVTFSGFHRPAQPVLTASTASGSSKSDVAELR